MRRNLIAFLSILMLAFFTGKAFGENNRVLWGVKASIGAELPGKWHVNGEKVSMYSPGVGFSIGAVSNIYLARNFYFEPGVSLFFSKYKYKDLIIMGDASNEFEYESDPGLHKWGLQIPLVVGYTIGSPERFQMNIYTGPELRYAFAGSIDLKNKYVEDYINDTFDLWSINGHRRFDLAWRVGIGFPVGNFDIAFEADFGVTDLMKNVISYRENRLGLAITYFF